MHNRYEGVTTRFLRSDERLMESDANELPFVIEAHHSKDVNFLQTFLAKYSTQILEDIAQYGAVLLRGFDVQSEHDFENTILKIQGFKGIGDAFMSEQGRVPVGHLKYVLHTNSVYKTGGTLYLGGFHSENYYSPDVPSYISFCCLKPSKLGGETGLVQMEKLYTQLDPALKAKLEKNAFFVSKWLMSEVVERYQVPAETIEQICAQFDLPIIGDDKDKFILMYKPSVFTHPITQTQALQINFFEIPSLNEEMRKHFMKDYEGKTWFWHRFVWRLPTFVLRLLELIYMSIASMYSSPKESFHILKTKYQTRKAAKKIAPLMANQTKVGSCFNEQEVKKLAQLIRQYYSSILWKKGDVLIVDNRKVAHAGMPGAGPRVIRAMIGNPLEMKYSHSASGHLYCKPRTTETIAYHLNEARNTRNMMR